MIPKKQSERCLRFCFWPAVVPRALWYYPTFTFACTKCITPRGARLHLRGQCAPIDIGNNVQRPALSVVITTWGGRCFFFCKRRIQLLIVCNYAKTTKKNFSDIHRSKHEFYVAGTRILRKLWIGHSLFEQTCPTYINIVCCFYLPTNGVRNVSNHKFHRHSP